MTKKGWARHHELKRQDAAAKQEIIAGLISELGRSPTMSDRLAIESLASLHIWARVLERRGRFEAAAEVRDQIVRTQRTNGIKPQPIEAKPQHLSPADRFRQRAEAAS